MVKKLLLRQIKLRVKNAAFVGKLRKISVKDMDA